MDKIRM